MLLPRLALALLVTLGDPSPKKGYYALADMVDHADFICIGRVDEIVMVSPVQPLECGFSQPRGELPIARVTVERVLEGDATADVVYHEAWGTWTCDTTSAHVGEHALFLLSRTGCVAAAPDDVRNAVHAVIGSTNLFRNVGSGDGIQRITDSDGLSFVGGSGVPRALEFEGSTRLADVIRYVEELQRFSLDAVAVHARSGHAWLNDTAGYDLRILPSGEARLATRLGPREEVRTFQLDPRDWVGLRNDLGALVAGQERRIGSKAEHWPRRRLSVRADDGLLEFIEPATPRDPSGLTPAERLDLRDFLDAWTRVLGAIDCSECPSYAEEDRQRLEMLR